MKVLIACEESQEVCKAFRAKGYEEVYSGEWGTVKVMRRNRNDRT